MLLKRSPGNRLSRAVPRLLIIALSLSLSSCVKVGEPQARLTVPETSVRPSEKELVITFQKRFSRNGKASGLDLKLTADGGYILTGMSWPAGEDYNSDMYLVKTDAYGELVWEKTFGGDQAEESYSVQEADDGGYVLFGTTKSFGKGGSDLYLVKTDSYGGKLWERTFGGRKADSGRSIAKTSDGGYIMIGYTKSFGGGAADIFAVKTDADGNETDSKTFGTRGDEWGRSVTQTKDGGYVLLGNIPGRHGDMLLIRVDCCGNELWRKTYGGLGKEKGQEIRETSDGGYIMVGTIKQYGRVDDDIYIVKTDADGNELWSDTIGGKERDWGYSVTETRDGGYVICGTTKSYGEGDSDIYLVKVILDGDELYKVFEKTFGGTKSDLGWSVQETPDGGLAILGWTQSYDNPGGEMYLIKVNANGEF